MAEDCDSLTVTPADRARARIALDLARRQLSQLPSHRRRNLHAEILHKWIAVHIEDRLGRTTDTPKQAIWAAQQEFGVSERTARTAWSRSDS